MKKNKLPNLNYLNECFYYSDGFLFWKIRPDSHFKKTCHFITWNKKYSGKIAGRISKYGYQILFIDKKPYYAHRIIWKIKIGSDPLFDIDHINNVRSDNRIENLRDIEFFNNKKNRLLNKNNLTGLKGVCFYKDRYIARIQVNGKNMYLGCFINKEDAYNAYCNASKEHHKDFHNFG
jgi:hypothetical protein